MSVSIMEQELRKLRNGIEGKEFKAVLLSLFIAYGFPRKNDRYRYSLYSHNSFSLTIPVSGVWDEHRL